VIHLAEAHRKAGRDRATLWRPGSLATANHHSVPINDGTGRVDYGEHSDLGRPDLAEGAALSRVLNFICAEVSPLQGESAGSMRSEREVSVVGGPERSPTQLIVGGDSGKAPRREIVDNRSYNPSDSIPPRGVRCLILNLVCNACTHS
jgi:hypothetical protein